ncbi:DNA alkylation repair enzyme superfamily [Synechococcus sp. PCC 7335]|uniref:DNA alkylation repair protein n=1 Tax=Synechococcus sp. (strain ATCC 29403 / PCC 7335) TaxID=91464 RepID=UPI00017EC749|nr:DNA alkylation repair protein [Synechococcus sp. PCC 7335]EDX84280.1 DNA alkylation repair enzyme superfamily [Synechococcus sp. PCC 7335]
MTHAVNFEQRKQALAEDLTVQLSSAADEKTKQWFDNYLKGAIEYRGVKTPIATQLVISWQRENDLSQYSTEEQLALCKALVQSRFAEDKFAGIIYLQKFLRKTLSWPQLVSFSADLFELGYFFDWSTTDWFCVRVLDPTIIQHGLAAAEAIAEWRSAQNLWQKRASIVSFRRATQDTQYHSLIEQVIKELVVDDQRFIQTGIGWVLADMSKPYPQEAETLFRKYLSQLSREVIDRHTKHLDAHQELKRLKRSPQLTPSTSLSN